MIRQCKDHDVAYFLKQLGSTVHHKGRLQRFSDGHAGDWSEWPEHLRVREMPEAPAPMAVPTVAEAELPTRIALDIVEIRSKARGAAPEAGASRRGKRSDRTRTLGGMKPV